MPPRSERADADDRFDPAVRAAIGASHLRPLDPETLQRLLAGSAQLSVPAGSTIHREGHSSEHFEIVVSGLVRVYVGAPDGRTLTVRYCRPGAILGAVSLFASPFSLPATIQAVTDTELLALRPSAVRHAADRDVVVSRALLSELSERVLSFIAEIPGSVFASVRQRVARHLLDLATESQRGSMLVAEIGQQDLADAVGTAREVVVRVLRELREEGSIRTERGAIVLLTPERLASEAYRRATGTEVPDERSTGR
ncbi:MAG TPA: Crp/Fnr family transcriptional regulator [Gaiellaceae bacterium]|nr:Crp/Fnr family transcriptional regulator [Gaiellaceae bacterium]